MPDILAKRVMTEAALSIEEMQARLSCFLLKDEPCAWMGRAYVEHLIYTVVTKDYAGFCGVAGRGRER
jgi:hypothetical protein